MACFPRLFHHRSKNKFTPGNDKNTDTILNAPDNPVQIGKYIRREEKLLYTPIITPNGTERRLKQSALLQVVANNENGITATPITTPTAAAAASQRQPKKFRSNRARLQQATAVDNNGDGVGNSDGVVTNGNAINVTHCNTTTNDNNTNKLKPVKERRPTALPTEIPSVLQNDENHDDDDVDDGVVMVTSCFDDTKSKLKVNVNGIIDVSDNYDDDDVVTRTPPATPTSTPTSMHTPTSTRITTITPSSSVVEVKFFIGHTQEANNYNNNNYNNTDDTSDGGDVVNNNSNNDNDSKLTNGTLPQAKHGQQQRQQQQQQLLQQQLHQLQLRPQRPLKTSSNVSLNYLTKCKPSSDAGVNADGTNQQLQQQATRTNLLQRRVSTMPDIYISPLAPPPPPPPPLPPSDLLRPSTTLILPKKKKSTSLGKEGSELNLNAQDQILVPTDKSDDKRDNAAAADDDDDKRGGSTKAQRVEGGLIFARPNLPVQKNIEIEFTKKDKATSNLIHNAIEKNDFLNSLMDKERKEMVINAMVSANYSKDSYIIHEREEGSEIYVSAEGYYDVLKSGEFIGNFGPATVFGELAILYNAPRQASVRAATNARVWKITRDTFRAIMQISGCREREENLQFLRSVPILQELEESQLGEVVDLLQQKFYETGSCIVKEGEVGNEFFIIRCGTVTIKKLNSARVEQVVASRKRGDYFGEQALTNADRRTASVYADAPGTEVLLLEREAFASYLGRIKQLSEKPNNQDDLLSSNKTEFDNKYANIPISELKKIATLGAGAFGRVDLVTYGKQAFALKVIKKYDVVKQDQIEHIYNEKNVMIKCRHSPFIVELYRTYRNDKYVYFLMEACMGGDVWTVMSKRQYFDEKTARFIVGCVVEAFEFLHSYNIIYRDLKPENLMLTTDGYCKLVDFGFAKHLQTNTKTNTFAGTPEYVAPEIIQDRGHDRAVDYWALGILIFELLVGRTPFKVSTTVKIYQQILMGIDLIHMPSRIPRTAQNLIRGLCKQNPRERLGNQRKGIRDIKNHSWFNDLDWVKLQQKQLTSPIKRPIKGYIDIQYFGECRLEKDYEPPEELSGWDKDF